VLNSLTAKLGQNVKCNKFLAAGSEEEKDWEYLNMAGKGGNH